MIIDKRVSAAIFILVTIAVILFMTPLSAATQDELMDRLMREKSIPESDKIAKKLFEQLDFDANRLTVLLMSNGYTCGKNKNEVDGQPVIIRCLRINCKNVFRLGWKSNSIHMKFEDGKYEVDSVVINYSWICPSKKTMEEREKWVYEKNPFVVEMK